MVRAVPFTWITAPGTKVLPVTVTVVGVVVPSVSTDGFSCIAPIGGLFTATVPAADVPPPGLGFTAVNEIDPVAARSAAVRVAVTCVALV